MHVHEVEDLVQQEGANTQRYLAQARREDLLNISTALVVGVFRDKAPAQTIDSRSGVELRSNKSEID